MQTVWKYQLQHGETTLELPRYARVLSVGYDLSTLQPVIWFLVDPESEESTMRRFKWIGTGHPLGDSVVPDLYLGSVQITTTTPNLVWHVWETT